VACQTALNIPPNGPPPWLINMQRYGPPPSYPGLRIPGLNAPLPPGCVRGGMGDTATTGRHLALTAGSSSWPVRNGALERAGGASRRWTRYVGRCGTAWQGRAGTDSSCVHQFGRPLYGDLSNIIVVPPPPEVWRAPRCTQTRRHVAHPLVGGGGVQASPVEKMTWGAMDDYEEEPEEEDEEDEENAEDGVEGGAAGAAAGEAGARGDDADDDDGKGTWRAGGRGAYTD
jgi:hypothetical protein